ncbi:MAG: sensor histidine kinase, partial [Anaerolineales bacterium]
DAQQRLFTMTGQLEKLKSDQAHLERYAAFLARTVQLLEGGTLSEQVGMPIGGETGLQQIVEAQEEERYNISRQIHDGPAQSLSNFILQAEIAMRLLDRDQDAARQEMANLKKAATQTFSRIRSFIFDLRPMMLDDLGLVPTLRRYVDVMVEDSGLEIDLVITGTERRIGPHREVMVFRGIQELLKNARKHAQATQVKVALDLGQTQVRASVEDNGRGMEEGSFGAEDAHGRGLRSLEKRIHQVGGVLDIDSRPGQGTRVSFTIPSAA